MKDSFKIKDYWLERHGSDHIKSESWEESRWTIHEGDTWYLINGPKLMSSWAHGAHKRFCEISFRTSDLSIDQVHTNEKMLAQGSEFTQPEAEKFAKRVTADWEKLRNGENSSKKLAEIIAGATLALDISLVCAIGSHTFTDAHMKYGRK